DTITAFAPRARTSPLDPGVFAHFHAQSALSRCGNAVSAFTMGYVAVETVTKLDARTLRADFPIFEQEFHGKPLAFLDSAASSQKPRQMLEAMNRFYETSYANVHR